MKKTLALVITALFLAVPAALAGNLPDPNSGSISVAAGSDLSYQGQVTFDYSYPGKLKNPRVYVHCEQEGSLVYGEAGGASATFMLGGGWSQWVGNGGGAASCVADLYYFKVGNHEWNGSGQQEYVLLAETSFEASA